MKTLIEILTEQTQSLKKQYLEFTKNWAKKHFDFSKKQLEKYYKLNSEQCNIFNNRHSNPKIWKEYQLSENFQEEKKLSEFFGEYKRIVDLGKKKYIKVELLKAESHYESSIIKLAERIQKKNLNESKLKVTTSHIGVNIETILTDENQTIKAFTIVAQGRIQKPHYRYLVH